MARSTSRFLALPPPSLPLIIPLAFALAAACGSAAPGGHIEPVESEGVLSPEALEAHLDHPADPTGADCVGHLHCEDADPCTENRCIEGTCESLPIPGGACCEVEILWASDLDDSSAAAINVGPMSAGVGWHPTTTWAASPPTSLGFTHPEQGSYAVGVAVAGAMSLPPLELAADRVPRLSLQLAALVETSPFHDLLVLEADRLTEAGEVIETIPLLDKSDLPPTAFDGFALVSVAPQELAGERVRFRLRFDSIDHHDNDHPGVFVDDLELAATCPLMGPCGVDADCDDGDPCTSDACSPEGCVHQSKCSLDDGPAEGTLEPSAESTVLGDPGAATGGESTEEPDADPPEEPVGDPSGEPGGDPSGEPVGDPAEEPGSDPAGDPCNSPEAGPDCCTSHEHCDDSDAATLDVCEGATCTWTPNLDLCTSDADCVDGEPCTLDSCQGGTCAHAGSFGAACCSSDSVVELADFDSGQLEGLYVTDNLEAGVFWTTDPTRSSGGDFALYCGDPLPQTYAIGERVKSSVTTPLFAVPVGGSTSAGFQLLKQTRTTPDYDVLQVFVLRGGALQEAWSSKALPSGTTGPAFEATAVSLDAWAGQAIQLRVVFDSVDGGASPDLEGVYLDSLVVETTCQ